MIPEDKSEAVARGVRDAFGRTDIEHISKITSGQTSSLVFRIVVSGSPYLLKIITRTDDPTRHYRSMQAAAEAGVAPRVWYTSIEDKISITDFISTQPLPLSKAAVRLPAVLRTVHSLESFGRSPFNTTCTFLLDEGPMLKGYLEKFQAANLLPPTDNAELFARYEELAAVYPYGDEEMVSSHNDLFKPDNMLFDGNAVWLVDWEAAFLNDRYADLAAVANQVVTGEQEEKLYLQRYFGAPPTSYQLARFHLMQQIAHVFYAIGFLFLGSAGKPIDWTESIPEFTEYHRRMWAGEVDVREPSAKILYAKVHLERLRHNVRQPRYEEALRIISDRG